LFRRVKAYNMLFSMNRTLGTPGKVAPRFLSEVEKIDIYKARAIKEHSRWTMQNKGNNEGLKY